MYKTLKATWPQDPDMPLRSFEMAMRNRVLDNTLYDQLPYAFHEERTNSGEYIELRKRRPSARFNLCRSVVEDSVSLLFSEAHFPGLHHSDVLTREQLTLLTKEIDLNEVYLDAGLKGSVGSVAIFVRVLRNRVFLDARTTTYLTPTWDPQAPDTLLAVTELYKVKGKALRAAGYGYSEGKEIGDNTDYWLKTVWDATAETTFLPVEVKRDDDKEPVWLPDPDRTVVHGIGFVPVSWVKNLPGGDAIDGQPTFQQDALSINIELDYLLSQNGRSLKYGMDPTLVIKEPAFGQGNDKNTEGKPAPMGGAGNAVKVDAEGDAKLLEASGAANQAVIEHLRTLRELALESMKGNRASAEKLASAQSGKALELLNQTLVWLADRLRITYGEKSLRKVLQMVISLSQKFPLVFEDGTPVGELKSGPITLVWPTWYAPTPSESLQRIQTLSMGVQTGIISRETAVRTIAAEYDIEDQMAELKLIEAELAKQAELAKPAAPGAAGATGGK